MKEFLTCSSLEENALHRLVPFWCMLVVVIIADSVAKQLDVASFDLLSEACDSFNVLSTSADFLKRNLRLHGH